MEELVTLNFQVLRNFEEDIKTLHMHKDLRRSVTVSSNVTIGSGSEKTQVSKSPNNFSKIGLRSSLVKGGSIGTNDNVGTNKPKFSRIPSLRPAAPQTTKPASPSQVQKNSSPVNFAQATCQFDKEEKHGELSQVGRIANELNSVSDKIQKENMLPAYKTNNLIRHSSGEGQKISVVDIMDEKMSSLSLSETTDLVVGN